MVLLGEIKAPVIPIEASRVAARASCNPRADAYDSRGDLVKRFDPTEFEKVQGEYQLQEMEIRNRKTGSRTRIEFDLGQEGVTTPAARNQEPDNSKKY